MSVAHGTRKDVRVNNTSKSAKNGGRGLEVNGKKSEKRLKG